MKSKADLPVHNLLTLKRPGWHRQPGEPQVVVQCIEFGCAQLEFEEGENITAGLDQLVTSAKSGWQYNL